MTVSVSGSDAVKWGRGVAVIGGRLAVQRTAAVGEFVMVDGNSTISAVLGDEQP
jgi:hypothetical protein